MRGFNLEGVHGVCGISTAFMQNTEALNAVARVSFDNEYSDFYVHGLPRHTDQMLKVPGFTDGNNVAFWMWESTQLSPDFEAYADYYGAIWTASEYCAELLRPLGKPVHVIPHCVTNYLYEPETSRDETTILVAFNMNSRMIRKNPFFAIDTLLEVAKKRKIRVIFKVMNGPQTFFDHLQHAAAGLDCEWITRDLSRDELNQLYLDCDVYYSPHKSEGFGMHLLDAMAFGKKVVATGYSGCMEFLNSENSYLIDYKLDDVDDDFYKGVWAFPKRDSAIDCLVAACDEGTKKNEAAFKQALNFTLANTTKEVLSAL